MASSSAVWHHRLWIARNSFKFHNAVFTCETRQLRWFSQHCSCRQVPCGRCVRCDVSPARMVLYTFCVTQQNTTFWGGVAHSNAGLWPQIWTWLRFLYDASTPQVSSSYVYSFGSYRVDKQTNRFRRKHPTFFAMLQRWVIKLFQPSSTSVWNNFGNLPEMSFQRIIAAHEYFPTC